MHGAQPSEAKSVTAAGLSLRHPPMRISLLLSSSSIDPTPPLCFKVCSSDILADLILRGQPCLQANLRSDARPRHSPALRLKRYFKADFAARPDGAAPALMCGRAETCGLHIKTNKQSPCAIESRASYLFTSLLLHKVKQASRSQPQQSCAPQRTQSHMSDNHGLEITRLRGVNV